MSELPTYSYRPPATKEAARLRSCSSRRARLHAGGTYFRVREPGQKGNQISVQAIELEAPTAPGTGEAYCVITNQNLKYDENVLNAKVKILTLNASYQDLWVIDQLLTTPRARKYSISLKIRNQILNGEEYDLSTEPVTELGDFTFGKLFTSEGKISVLLQKSDVEYAENDVVLITPRVRIHSLLAVSNSSTPAPDAPPETIPETELGWGIDDLRTKVNTTNPWIQMPARGSDPQDSGEDALVLSPFGEQRFVGGDGLPDTPSAERTGPFRSLVHVNYGEQEDGTLVELNTVYEWVGEDAVQGSWQKY